MESVGKDEIDRCGLRRGAARICDLHLISHGSSGSDAGVFREAQREPRKLKLRRGERGYRRLRHSVCVVEADGRRRGKDCRVQTGQALLICGDRFARASAGDSGRDSREGQQRMRAGEDGSDLL